MEKVGMEVDGEEPSLPSNYVTILQLKERWLQQQQLHNPPKSNPDSQFNTNPNPNPIPIPNKPNFPPNSPSSSHRHRVTNQLKPPVTVHDSGSKTLPHVAANHQKGEKQEHNTDSSDSKLSTKKNASRGPKPRSITDQNPPTLLEPPPAEEKKHKARRRSGKQKVIREPGDKTPPFARNDGLSHNDARGVAAVKESNVPNVSQGNNRRGDFGRFHGVPRFGPSKPSFGSKKGQVSLVWVKKGESAPN